MSITSKAAKAWTPAHVVPSTYHDQSNHRTRNCTKHFQGAYLVNRIVLLLTLLFVALNSHAEEPKQLMDVAYGSHARQVLDFYQAKSDKPTPVVLYIHGGGW